MPDLNPSTSTVPSRRWRARPLDGHRDRRLTRHRDPPPEDLAGEPGHRGSPDQETKRSRLRSPDGEAESTDQTVSEAMSKPGKKLVDAERRLRP